MAQPLWNEYGASSEKLKIGLPYDSAIPLLGLSKGNEITPRDSYTQCSLQH